MANNILFDLLAPLYNRVATPRAPDKLIELLKLPCDGWLLDAGGGTGRVASPLRDLVAGVVLSDLSHPMLVHAIAKDGLRAVQARAQRLPFADASFARVLVVDALHHFGDQKGAIGELLRVLQPGGRLVIEEPDIEHVVVKVIALIEKLALMGSHMYKADEIDAMLHSYGVTAHIEKDDSHAVWVVVDK